MSLFVIKYGGKAYGSVCTEAGFSSVPLRLVGLPRTSSSVSLARLARLAASSSAAHWSKQNPTPVDRRTTMTMNPRWYRGASSLRRSCEPYMPAALADMMIMAIATARSAALRHWSVIHAMFSGCGVKLMLVVSTTPAYRLLRLLVYVSCWFVIMKIQLRVRANVVVAARNRKRSDNQLKKTEICGG